MRLGEPVGRLLGHGHDAAKRNLGSVRAIRHEQIYSKNVPLLTRPPRARPAPPPPPRAARSRVALRHNFCAC